MLTEQVAEGMHYFPMAQYLADPAPQPSLSNSMAHLMITQSPAHVWAAHPRLNPDHRPQNNSMMDAGTLAHHHLFGADDREIVIVIADDWRTKAAQTARNEAWAEGKIPALERVNDVAILMAVRAREYLAGSELAGILDTGDSEVTMLWRIGRTWCRARVDHYAESIMLDYKSTATSASPAHFTRQMVNMGYDMQAEWYLRGGRALQGPDPNRQFVFLVQENYKPFACSLIGAGTEMLELAGRKVDRATAMWASCTATGQWPAYPNRIAWADPPGWAAQQWEEREALDPLLAEQA